MPSAAAATATSGATRPTKTRIAMRTGRGRQGRRGARTAAGPRARRQRLSRHPDAQAQEPRLSGSASIRCRSGRRIPVGLSPAEAERSRGPARQCRRDRGAGRAPQRMRQPLPARRQQKCRRCARLARGGGCTDSLFVIAGRGPTTQLARSTNRHLRFRWMRGSSAVKPAHDDTEPAISSSARDRS